MTKRKTASKLAEQPRIPGMNGLHPNLLGIREAERDGRLTWPDLSLSLAREAFRHHTYFSDRAKRISGRAGNTLYIE